MSDDTPTPHSLTLTGLDGCNPLAFLAALGMLRTLTRACSGHDFKMSWAIHGGMWAPTLHCNKDLDQNQLLTILTGTLDADAAKHPIAFMNDTAAEKKGRGKKGIPKSDGGDAGSDEQSKGKTDTQATTKLFRTRASAAASPADRDGLDWLSAMTSDLAPEATSQLQTARRDYFWGNLQSVMNLTKTDHLRRTLFLPWDYADPLDNQSLHIEPSEDRRHAHQWSQPSGDPGRKKSGGMLGANRLAIEAFPLFQSLPAGEKLGTRGFSGLFKDETRWTWSIWTCPIGVDVVTSLLALAEIQAETPDQRLLSARGIAIAFRCRRILVGKTPNFTPAMAVS